jgi:hypothetical protein
MPVQKQGTSLSDDDDDDVEDEETRMQAAGKYDPTRKGADATDPAAGAGTAAGASEEPEVRGPPVISLSIQRKLKALVSRSHEVVELGNAAVVTGSGPHRSGGGDDEKRDAGGKKMMLAGTLKALASSSKDAHGASPHHHHHHNNSKHGSGANTGAASSPSGGSKLPAIQSSITGVASAATASSTLTSTSSSSSSSSSAAAAAAAASPSSASPAGSAGGGGGNAHSVSGAHLLLGKTPKSALGAVLGAFRSTNLQEIVALQQKLWDEREIGGVGPYDIAKVLPRRPVQREHTGVVRVKVFVAATAKDTVNERNILEARVFPALRESLRDINVVPYACDLRRGVTADGHQSGALEIGMSEVDELLRQTPQPLFVCIVGEKYGWVPPNELLTPSFKHQYSWVDGWSLLAHQLLRGAFRVRNPNALILTRDPSFLAAPSFETLPLRDRALFVDMEWNSETNALSDRRDVFQVAKLAALKRAMRRRFHGSGQYIEDYPASFAGLDAQGRVRLSGLDSFARSTLAFCQSAIREMYALPPQAAAAAGATVTPAQSGTLAPPSSATGASAASASASAGALPLASVGSALSGSSTQIAVSNSLASLGGSTANLIGGSSGAMLKATSEEGLRMAEGVRRGRDEAHQMEVRARVAAIADGDGTSAAAALARARARREAAKEAEAEAAAAAKADAAGTPGKPGKPGKRGTAGSVASPRDGNSGARANRSVSAVRRRGSSRSRRRNDNDDDDDDADSDGSAGSGMSALNPRTARGLAAFSSSFASPGSPVAGTADRPGSGAAAKSKLGPGSSTTTTSSRRPSRFRALRALQKRCLDPHKTAPIVIAGPPGCGKSTLISSFIQEWTGGADGSIPP